MPLPAAVRKVATEIPWASTGDRTDPDDPSLTPPIDVSVGWPPAFSANETPRRRVFNELFHRLFSAGHYVARYGILPWDAAVDYEAGASVQAGTQIWRATEATGPATSNATDPTTGGQTIWSPRVASETAPAAPAAPSGTTSNGQIEWQWLCPLDNGSVITGFTIQWRPSGGTFGTVNQATTTHPRHVLSGLTNGSAYEARVRAANAEGNSPWSSVGSATPAAEVPDKVQGMRVDPAAASLDISWSEPDDNGGSITRYDLQWRTGLQAWDSSTRQATPTGTTHTIAGLANGTVYSVRVRAVNSAGNGAWSEIVSGTPAIPTPDLYDYSTAGSRTINWGRANTEALAFAQGRNQRQSGSDISIANTATGLAASATHLYALQNPSNERIIAFNASSRARDSSKDINPGNLGGTPQGMSISGTTLYVLSSTNAISRFDINTRRRISGDMMIPEITRDISVSPRALAVNATTVWVVGSDSNLYAFNSAFPSSNPTRDSSKDITGVAAALGTSVIQGASVSADGNGIWILGQKVSTNISTLGYWSLAPSIAFMAAAEYLDIASQVNAVTEGGGNLWISQGNNFQSAGNLRSIRGGPPASVSIGNQSVASISGPEAVILTGLSSGSSISTKQGANSRIVIAPL